MRKQIIITPGAYLPATGAHAVKIDDVLYTSALAARTVDGEISGSSPAEQAQRIYRDLDRVLQDAGARWADVAKIVHYISPALHHTSAIHELHRVAGTYLAGNRPALTEVCLASAGMDATLQVELIAHIGTGKRTLSNGEAAGPFAPGVCTGRHIYLSGRKGGNSEKLEGNTRQIYGSFGTLLEEAGCDWKDVTRVRQYLADTEIDFNHVRAGRQGYVPAGRFLSTSVANLPVDGENKEQICIDLDAVMAPKVALNSTAIVDTPGVAHALRVGSFLHLQAQIATDASDQILFPGDIEGQAAHVLMTLTKLLNAADLDWANIVTSRVFCKKSDDIEIVRRLERRWAGDSKFAGSDSVARFFDERVLVEIELSAHFGH